MIAALTGPRRKAAFLAAAEQAPPFRAFLKRDLALWADNPGAPVRLFALRGAALAVSGRYAWLCGAPLPPDDREELGSFLRFVGVERLRSTVPPPDDWPEEERIYCYALRPGTRLPPLPQPGGTRLDRALPVGEAADFLFGALTAERDDFYAETCPAAARGMARLWGLRGGAGELLCTVGAYALCGGEAYLAMGQTLPERRGQGLGGWLIASLANELAAEGRRVTFLCKPGRCAFYDRLGFAPAGLCRQYISPELQK